MRRAFTLIELLTVVAIMAIMVGFGVAGIGSGRRAVRVRGATRDIFAAIRHARSVALVTQQPSVVTYSTSHVDDEVCAKVEVSSARIFDANPVRYATTLSGERVSLTDDEPGADGGEEGGGGGETMEDVLFAPMSEDVVKGVRIRVAKEGETLGFEEGEAKSKPKISVFSNVDYLIGKFKEARSKEAEAKAAEQSAGAEEDAFAGKAAAGAEDQEEVSFVWEANGRTEPHRVWVYADGSSPDGGLCIKVDRFGAIKVLGDAEDD